MSEFFIDITKCKTVDVDLQSIENTLANCYSRLDTVLSKLNNNGIRQLNNQIRNQKTSIDNQKNKVRRLRNTLTSCINTYERTENSLVSDGYEEHNNPSETSNAPSGMTGYDMSLLEDFMRFIAQFNIIPGSALFLALYDLFIRNRSSSTNYSVDSVLYDDDGNYGGNQGSMIYDYRHDRQRRTELLEDIREYFPEITSEEADAYLDHLNSVGCGYTAMVNAIFMHYENNPAGFFRDFGFPMYRDGDLNYDRLLLDLYTYTDINNLNDGRDGLPIGTNARSRNRILDRYMEERGVSVRTQYDVTINADRIREITDNGGKVILSLHNDPIIDQSNIYYNIDGGHAMVVTGVDGDRLIVSSWGEEYYIDISSLDSNDSLNVIYFKDR